MLPMRAATMMVAVALLVLLGGATARRAPSASAGAATAALLAPPLGALDAPHHRRVLLQVDSPTKGQVYVMGSSSKQRIQMPNDPPANSEEGRAFSRRGRRLLAPSSGPRFAALFASACRARLSRLDSPHKTNPLPPSSRLRPAPRPRLTAQGKVQTAPQQQLRAPAATTYIDTRSSLQQAQAAAAKGAPPTAPPPPSSLAGRAPAAKAGDTKKGAKAKKDGDDDDGDDLAKHITVARVEATQRVSGTGARGELGVAGVARPGRTSGRGQRGGGGVDGGSIVVDGR